MKRLLTLLLCAACFLTHGSVYGQSEKKSSVADLAPKGISWQAWEKMNDRWQPYATTVQIKLTNGSEVMGHLVWASDSVMLVREDTSLPNGNLDPAGIKKVAYREMVSMKVRYGGHPYQGMLIGMAAGVIPGFVTGLILAQGWTIIPALVFGAVSAGGGATAGAFIQKAHRRVEFEFIQGIPGERELRKLHKTALFTDNEVPRTETASSPDLSDFENLVGRSRALKRAFPDNPFSLSIQTTLATNSVRKRLQNWFLEPVWGPPYAYYETRIGLQADVSRRIGKRFQAGVLFNLFPGDISSSFFNSRLEDIGVNYSYNHHFNQTTFGVYGGWLLQPADRFWATRLEATIQAGPVISDIYEHFYFQWEVPATLQTGSTFIGEHNWQPGGVLRLKTAWYLIPGLSVNCGLEGFWIRKVRFDGREVLPVTNWGSQATPFHSLNFSNLQGWLGVAVHW